MKLIHVLSLTVLKTILAQDGAEDSAPAVPAEKIKTPSSKAVQFEEQFEELKENEDDGEEIASEAAKAKSANPYARSLIVKETQSIFNLENYGCWCHADPTTGMTKGNGAPQDEFDKLCKKLYDGYQCIRMDSIEDGEECIPAQTHYKVAALDISKTAIETCGMNKADMSECQFMTCIVELNYVLEVFKLYIMRIYPDAQQYKHRNSPDEFGFDHQTACYPNQGGLRTTGLAGFFENYGDMSQGWLGKARDYFSGDYYTGYDENWDPSLYALDGDMSGMSGSTEVRNTNLDAGPKIVWPTQMCCGTIPQRHPFKPDNGKKRCCASDGKSYEYGAMVCCADGVKGSCM